MLGTFTHAVNELAFCIGYTTIVLSVVYVASKAVYYLIERKANKD